MTTESSTLTGSKVEAGATFLRLVGAAIVAFTSRPYDAARAVGDNVGSIRQCETVPSE